MRAMDAEQTAQRIKLGDRLEVAREIDHFLFFRRKADAQAAALELNDDGFTSSIERKRLTWSVEAHTASDVELDSVDGFVERMFDLAHRHNGVYDGWGAPVILKEHS